MLIFLKTIGCDKIYCMLAYKFNSIHGKRWYKSEKTTTRVGKFVQSIAAYYMLFELLLKSMMVVIILT